jgi:hypothetical protein
MLDLEYLAGFANAVVVQIGPCRLPFARANTILPYSFLSTCPWMNNSVRGRKIDARTLEWWMGQAVEKAALPPWFKDQQPVKVAGKLDQLLV